MLSLCVTALTFHQLGYVAANAFGFNNNILYDDKKKYLTRKKISTFFSQRTQAQLQWSFSVQSMKKVVILSSE